MREQCLPFTAAAALGLAIPSPITWGYCARSEVPVGGRAFRSPVDGGDPGRCFYVVDDPAYGFERNQFNVPPDIRKRIGPGPIPGLSFFDRPDQQDMVKLHLPYIWRTARGVDLLFLPPINRDRGDGVMPVSGLVETDWYNSSVNLVLQLPPAPTAVHIRAGDLIAQAVPVNRAMRQPEIEILESHRAVARKVADGVADWRDRHASDRSAYKRLARSQSGVIPKDPE